MNNLGRGPPGNASCKISKLQVFWFILRRFFKFFLSVAWQPEFCMESNSLNNFGRASCKEHPCQVSSNLAKWVRRRCCLKKLLTDARTHGRTDARTHDGRRTSHGHNSSPCHYVTGELKNINENMP